MATSSSNVVWDLSLRHSLRPGGHSRGRAGDHTAPAHVATTGTLNGFFFETKLGILVQMASPLQHGIGKFIGNQISILTFSSGYDVDRKLTQIQGLREFLELFATIPAF